MAATQETQSTQQRVDPRRLGRNNSGLSAQDVSDVICILHPASAAALDIVAYTAVNNPQHVLQNEIIVDENGEMLAESEQDTLLLRSRTSNRPLDLALRFSSHVSDPTMGFCFGRNQLKCDINLDPKEYNRRVSNVHFHIYLNENGVLMLEDVSTNGTIVNTEHLGSKRHPWNPPARMLEQGAVIEILNASPEDAIKFILRMPSRETFFDQYQANFQAYMDHVLIAQERAKNAKHADLKMTDAAKRRVLAAPLAGPVNPKVIPSTSLPKLNNCGINWDGGDKYNCISLLGKGAFATVYQIATIYEGDVFAAKELDKRRFVKNNQLDSRIETEMTIMQAISHPNIVKFIEYAETANHLYLIMEYVPGGDLQGYMQSHATLPEAMGKDMTRQILQALEYLHAQNVTHRDIKPDNILIASEDPFVVKLTDFGLSKVIRNNETFLKTFCGTLLYCAPEVFPHYDNYIANKRQKRRRRDGDPKHTYGQSVDVWSYAAVLWTALCGKPPFEGVVDANGRGMFDRIMGSALSSEPLQECGITPDGCEFLLFMLDTDPVSRPAESECLRHPWLNEGRWLEDPQDLAPTMEEIQEESDVNGLDASQLSIHDSADEPSNDSLGSDNMHPPKRPRAKVDPDETPRQGYQFEQVPIIRSEGLDGKQFPSTMPQFKTPKLFGEISQTALQSSGALGTRSAADQYPAMNNSFPDSSNGSSYGDSDILQMEGVEHSGPVNGSAGNVPRPAGAHHSLSGAESMVRELNMSSPNKGRSRAVTPDRTSLAAPHNGQTGTLGPAEAAAGTASQPDTTPKPKPNRSSRVIDRQISLPLTASAYFDPFDETTHNVDFASKISGHDFAAQPTADESHVKALPQDVQASFHSAMGGSRSVSGSNENLGPDRQSSPGASEVQPETNTPHARLVSTSDSFTQVNISLIKRFTAWGRAPGCDVVYTPARDDRVPKVGLELVFDAPGIGSVDKAGGDWTALPHLKLLVLTKSSNGVWVNGTRLLEKDSEGRRLYGRLAHGDVIDVYRPRGSVSQSSGNSSGAEVVEQGLSLVVDISLPAARWERGEKPFEVTSY